MLSTRTTLIGLVKNRAILSKTKHFPFPRLNVCRQLLEKQLKKAYAEERKMGIDLSGLRAQIKKEIADVDRRL